MLLLLHMIMTYIKENIISKLQKLYSLSRNPRVGKNLSMLFVKKPLCMSDLSPACKIWPERPVLDLSPSHLCKYSLSTSTLECYAQYIVISFFVFFKFHLCSTYDSCSISYIGNCSWIDCQNNIPSIWLWL